MLANAFLGDSHYITLIRNPAAGTAALLQCNTYYKKTPASIQQDTIADTYRTNWVY
jgi:hypothetical protein